MKADVIANGGPSTRLPMLVSALAFALLASDAVSQQTVALQLVVQSSRSPVNAVAISSNGRLALTAGYDNAAGLWDLRSGRVLRRFEGHSSRLTSVAFSPDGQIAVTGSWDQTARLWDVA